MFNIEPVSSGFPCEYIYVLYHVKLKILNIDIHRAFLEKIRKNQAFMQLCDRYIINLAWFLCHGLTLV